MIALFKPYFRVSIYRLALSVVIFQLFLIGLLCVANIVSTERMQKNFMEVAGEGSFTECEVALSLVVEQEHTLKSALSPATIEFLPNREPCEVLELYYNQQQDQLTYSHLRLRYIWGFRSVHAILVSLIPEPEVGNVVIGIVFSVGFLLLLNLRKYGVEPLLICCPFILGGLFFTGLINNGALPLSLSILWAWLTPLILSCLRSEVREELFLLLSGMVSAFLWFMGGEIMILVTLSCLVSFFKHPGRMSNANVVTMLFRNFLYIHIGFLICTLVFIVMKGFVFGWSEVLSSYSSAIAERSSNTGNVGESINVMMLLHKLIFVGFQYTSAYQNVLLWKFLIISSIVCFIYCLVTLMVNKRVRQLVWPYLILMTVMVGYVCLRILVIPNHSFVHARMISPYLIIPLAASWSLAIFISIALMPRKKEVRL